MVTVVMVTASMEKTTATATVMLNMDQVSNDTVTWGARTHCWM